MAAAFCLGGAPAAGDVTVEDVQPGFGADQAGLKPGDVLLGWERAASPPANPEPAAGSLQSPFELTELEREQAPRGEIVLLGTRGNDALRLRMPLSEWKLKARAPLAETDLASYLDGASLAAGGRQDEAFARWRALAAGLGSRGEHRKASWLLLKLARVADEKHADAEAASAFEAAVREAEAGGHVGDRALLQNAQGRFFEDHSDWDKATAAYREALAAYTSLQPDSLGVAWTLENVGAVALKRGDLTPAEDELKLALSIRERLAPESIDTANSLSNLGIAARDRGDLPGAESYYRRALAIDERLAPESEDMAATLNNLGVVEWYRGDLSSAEEDYRRALAIDERLVPDSLDLAADLNNIGLVLHLRGDLAGAEDHYQRALAIKERHAPDSLDIAASLDNLGVLTHEREDLAAAESYHKRALAIRERLAPESLELAASLGNLGNVASKRGNLSSAEAYQRRSLAIREKLAPQSLDVAASLMSVADLQLQAHRLAEAQQKVEASLAIAERLAPHALLASNAQCMLGDVARARGELQASETRYQRCLEIRRGLAPGSVAEANAEESLATLERRRGRLEQALAYHQLALDALEAQGHTLGGSDEVKSAFSARYAGYYREALDVLMRLGRPAEAFQVLERYRARVLLSLLAERDLRFSGDVPAELDRERRVANAEYDRLWRELAGAKPETVEQTRAALAQARTRQARVRDQIAAASPRLAQLQYPRPLDLEASRSALDPGTLLLSYSIGESRSYLFAVGPGTDDFVAVPLPATLATLREKVRLFRGLLQQGMLHFKELQQVSRQLSDELLRPVASRIARAERLLILADGPLHLMPFAALADPVAAGGFRYLVESKPVFKAASATVFAELTKRRTARRDVRLIAFGDPDYSAAPTGQGHAVSGSPLRAAGLRGLELSPLPATRHEVEGLVGLYPRSSRAYLGAEATEETAKAVAGQASLLHFACHGFADEASPLDSALVLSLPGAWRPGHDNGLLQAWEVFEQLRVDADMVALSACGTALGKEMSGEGVLGLTRAFQYAGARAVLASLWAVSDDSTAQLMRRLYAHLERGESKDDALRAAQLELIQGKAFAHPSRWAGFELIGDRR